MQYPQLQRLLAPRSTGASSTVLSSTTPARQLCASLLDLSPCLPAASRGLACPKFLEGRLASWTVKRGSFIPNRVARHPPSVPAPLLALENGHQSCFTRRYLGNMSAAQLLNPKAESRVRVPSPPPPLRLPLLDCLLTILNSGGVKPCASTSALVKVSRMSSSPTWAL